MSIECRARLEGKDDLYTVSQTPAVFTRPRVVPEQDADVQDDDSNVDDGLAAALMLMSADGAQVPISTLNSAFNSTRPALPVSVVAAGSIPVKKKKRVRAAAPTPDKENDQVTVAKPATTAKPKKLKKTQDDAPPLVPQVPAPPIIPPQLPEGTVQRDDEDDKTILRKEPTEGSGFNGVIVFNGDTIQILKSGHEYSHIQMGRKKGWIRTRYVTLLAADKDTDDEDEIVMIDDADVVVVDDIEFRAYSASPQKP